MKHVAAPHFLFDRGSLQMSPTTLELLPNFAQALDTRGNIFEALGQREEAIADVRLGLAKVPNMQSAHGSASPTLSTPSAPRRPRPTRGSA
jgi:hypothetical protein